LVSHSDFLPIYVAPALKRGEPCCWTDRISEPNLSDCQDIL
jgi:hypothetical protein